MFYCRMDIMTVSHRSISFCFLLALLVSLFALQWHASPLVMSWSVIVVIAVWVGAAFLLHRTLHRSLLIAILFGCLCSGLRVWHLRMEEQHMTMTQVLDGIHQVTGWISAAPERFPTFTRYTLSVHRVDGRSVRGMVLVTDRTGWPQYDVGDAISVEGKIETPGIIDAFDYGEYLRIAGIAKVVHRATVRTLHDDPPAPFFIRISPLRILVPVREWFERRISLILPEPAAALLTGLLTGTQHGMSRALKDDFRAAGLTHIVAISGSNITIILSFLSGLLFFVPINRRFLPLSLGIACFALFVGANPPVIRASIMGILGLLAIRAERRAEPRLLLLWTAAAMSMWNPLELWHSASFHLSFLATLGIGEIGPLFKRWLSFMPESFGLRDSLATTLAAQVATLPVTMLVFRQVSIVAPLTNLLVAPLIPLAMLTGFLATIAGTVSQSFGLLLGYLAWLLLQSITGIATLGASVPFSAIAF